MNMNYYVKHSLWISVIVLLFIFAITTFFLIFDGLDDKIEQSDVAIVLGSQVNPDGSLSGRLEARLDKAIELYRNDVVPAVIVSGGTGRSGYNEALVMKKYLLAHQIPESVIFVDGHGINTRATAFNSADLMRTHGFKSALIVTQYFHISRTYLALQQCGIAPIYTSHAHYFELRDVYSIVREVFGFYYYLLIKRDCGA